MEIKIKTNKDKYFRQLIEVLGVAKPFSLLSNKEREVLSFLLHCNYAARNLPDEERFKYVFSEEVKEQIRMKYNMSKYSLNNYMFSLRKKGFTTYFSILKPFELTPEKEITFKFEKEE
jgi:hypothetical protein